MTTTLIIGASRGIGLELATQSKARGDKVIATCRTPTAELKALGVQLVDGVEMTKEDDAKALAKTLGEGSLDVCIINAGIMRHTGLDDINFDAVREQFEVNAMGPLRFAAALRGCFKSPSKLGLVTSRMGSVADNTSGGAYGYRMSKAALNMAGVSLARDLADDKVAVAILHPGWVKTEMTGGTGNSTAAESAAGLLARMNELSQETSGTFWHMNGEVLPW